MPRVATKTKPPSEAQLAARAAGAERFRAVAQKRMEKAAKAETRSETRRLQSVRSPKRFVDTEDQEIGSEAPRKMKSTGPARAALEPRFVEPVEKWVDPQKLENLAFMQEEVTVLIHPSEDPYAVQFPEVWNGSRKETFQRGVPQRTKRMFVEVLARMKMTKYRQEKVTDRDGVEGYRYVPYSALAYPFVIDEDTPKGRAWLKSILAEG